MGRRRVRLASEAAKFLTVGGLATFLSFVLFNILVHGVLGPGPMHEDPLVAFVVANTVGMAVSYRGSRSWAFQGRQVVGVAGGRLTFVVINVLSMTVPLACLSFARYVLHRSDPIADNLAANVVGLGLGTVVRFWAIQRFIFVSRSRALLDVRVPLPVAAVWTGEDLDEHRRSEPQGHPDAVLR